MTTKEIFVETRNDVLQAMESNPSMNWYIIQAAANSEEAAKRNILEQLTLRGKDSKVGMVLIPAIKAKESKIGGPSKIVKKKLFTGYIFILAEMDDEMANLIRNSSKVSKFVKQDPKTLRPVTISKKEIEQVISSLKEENDTTIQHKKEYELGTKMRVTAGPFKDFSGVVSGVNYEKSMIKLEINVFNRKSEVEINIADLEQEI